MGQVNFLLRGCIALSVAYGIIGNGEVGYYHQLLGAVMAASGPTSECYLSFPEAITHQDGATKNDCEMNASKRLLPQLR